MLSAGGYGCEALVLEMLFEERQYFGHRLHVEDRTVILARADAEGDIVPGLLEVVGEDLRLAERHGRIGVAVEDQEGRETGMDVGLRAGVAGERGS